MKKILTALILSIFLFLVKNASAKIYFNDMSNSNKIYLTFDDGYSLKNTKEIFKTCEENKVPVTFFFHGDFLSNCKVTVNKIAKSPYATIGSHTFSHRDIRTMSLKDLKDDLILYEKTYFEATGTKLTKLFRPPMGFIDKSREDLIESLGYKIYKWDVSYYDYNYQDDRGYKFVLNNLKCQTKSGSIILMHTMINSNVKVLPEFIKYARDNGYIFSDLKSI